MDEVETSAICKQYFKLRGSRLGGRVGGLKLEATATVEALVVINASRVQVYDHI
jgi:hypothetical protein